MGDDAIDELYRAWSDAFRTGDFDAIAGLLTPDYVLFAPGREPVGIDALRPQLERVFAAFEVSIAFEREERIVSGELAYERGWDVQTVRPRDGGEVREQRQRVFLILQRGDDGRWRFARGVVLP
ncbi:MAG: SgcJ/EcaC family oxidoreductase [Acidobacteria bacterium]|nr:SgcJ/EcaC family oxidoreductase [Acidobacteriota bacterium]MBV9474822.1 SgcJ/EcaC family oxidoreductase [Acidobacteriota bacterium]